jgi:hypothetical protein
VTATPAELEAATARIQAVARARAGGATWAQIGARLKMSGPEAKRSFRLLERDTRRQFLLAAQAGTLPG